jgi:uncharacterized phage protein (TIGR02216 family)
MDWRALMQAGLRGLGLTPAAFWALTPAELMLMLGLDGRAAPMDRARLMDLARNFPDHRTGADDGQSRDPSN